MRAPSDIINAANEAFDNGTITAHEKWVRIISAMHKGTIVHRYIHNGQTHWDIEFPSIKHAVHPLESWTERETDVPAFLKRPKFDGFIHTNHDKMTLNQAVTVTVTEILVTVEHR